jgi:Tol biopolymer transport system component
MLISCSGGNSTPDPEITGVQPDSGPPGALVTINGSGFSEEATNNKVFFNSVEADITSASASHLKATVPETATTGVISVKVGNQTVNGPTFTVESLTPGISSVDPEQGVVGEQVAISGMNFSDTASENLITFNGTEAQILNASEDELMTQVPQGATDGPIEITVDGKTTTGPDFDVINEGAVEFLFSRNGPDQDQSMILTFDGKDTPISATTSKATRGEVTKGSYTAELKGINDNCSLSGQNPRPIEIVAGDTTQTSYQITCTEISLVENRIVFVNDSKSPEQIYSMNPDGSDLTLFFERIGFNSFDISPDGSKIVFSQGPVTNSDLYVYDIDSSTFTSLTSNGSGNNDPAWSPDGTQIVFSRYDANRNPQIFVIDADGSNLTPLTDNNYSGREPDWSPDGTKIVFDAFPVDNYEIAVMDADGTNLSLLTNDPAGSSVRDQDPVWSPDGSKIAFASTRNGSFDIYTMAADGSNIVRITDSQNGRRDPAWSPDGTQIVFEGFDGNDQEIMTATADGSGSPSILTDYDDDMRYPKWGAN